MTAGTLDDSAFLKTEVTGAPHIHRHMGFICFMFSGYRFWFAGDADGMRGFYTGWKQCYKLKAVNGIYMTR